MSKNEVSSLYIAVSAHCFFELMPVVSWKMSENGWSLKNKYNSSLNSENWKKLRAQSTPLENLVGFYTYIFVVAHRHNNDCFRSWGKCLYLMKDKKGSVKRAPIFQFFLKENPRRLRASPLVGLLTIFLIITLLNGNGLKLRMMTG